MNEENVFCAEIESGWLVEPMLKFRIKIYSDQIQSQGEKEKVIVMDFLGLYFKEDGDSLPSLRITLNSDEAKRFAEKILELRS